MHARDPAAAAPLLLRAVSRWQLVGLAVNGVIGSAIYLLPASAAALIGGASVWAIALAGGAVALIVLSYAQVASYFREPGAAYLYTREAFGPFVGFEVGWMTWLTRIATAATLASALPLALAPLWPAATAGLPRAAIVTGALALLTVVNVIGVRTGARTAVALVIAKMVPLAFFVLVGAWFVEPARLDLLAAPPRAGLTDAALLLLFAYAGFENTAAAAGEYRNPQRDVPFALIAMIAIVTLTYVAIQVVALGTLPDLAGSRSPLAEATAGFAGAGGAMLMICGAAVSILGTLHNTLLMGPRYAYALALGGTGPRALARVHPRFRTPAVAIVAQTALSLPLALSGSFVQLALLSVITRLITYFGTIAALLVLRRRHAERPGALRLPGGPLIPLGALLVSGALIASVSAEHLAAAGAALVAGALIYRFWRAPAASTGTATP